MSNTLFPVNNMLHCGTGINGAVFCNHQYFMYIHLVSDHLPVLDPCYKNCYSGSICNHCIVMHDGYQLDFLDWHAGTRVNNMPVNKPTLAE